MITFNDRQHWFTCIVLSLSLYQSSIHPHYNQRSSCYTDDRTKSCRLCLHHKHRQGRNNICLVYRLYICYRRQHLWLKTSLKLNKNTKHIIVHVFWGTRKCNYNKIIIIIFICKRPQRALDRSPET